MTATAPVSTSAPITASLAPTTAPISAPLVALATPVPASVPVSVPVAALATTAAVPIVTTATPISTPLAATKPPTYPACNTIINGEEYALSVSDVGSSIGGGLTSFFGTGCLISNAACIAVLGIIVWSIYDPLACSDTQLLAGCIPRSGMSFGLAIIGICMLCQCLSACCTGYNIVTSKRNSDKIYKDGRPCLSAKTNKVVT